LNYRNERRAEAETGSGLPAPYDSVMMTFVDMDLAQAWSSCRRIGSCLACHLFQAAQFQAEAADSSTWKRSMPVSMRRAPPPFCSRQGMREQRC
jgi:hypothetical protein